MRFLALLFLVVLFGCQPEQVEPNQEPNTYCSCGEVTNINQYYPNTYFTYTIKNNCTGNSTTADSALFVDYGNDICLNYSW